MKAIIDIIRIMTVFIGVTEIANASGFALIEQNASGMGNAFAGAAAVAEDASTIFFNPAGMSYLPDSQLVMAGHAIKPSGTFSNNDSRTISPVGAPVTLHGGDGGDAGDWGFVPNLYATQAVTDTIHLGIGVNAPFGLKTQYDDGWVGRYQALKSELQTININPSISFKFNDKLSLGAGISAQHTKATLTNALDIGTLCYGKVNPAICSGVLGLTPQNNDGHISIKGDDWSLGYNLGLIFQPFQSTRIGVAYRSSINYTLKGNATFGNVPTAFATSLANGQVTAKLDMPDSFSGSIAHQFNGQWELLADATWTGWNKFKQLSVIRTSGLPLYNQPEHWTNTMRYSIGASYRFTNKLKIRVGTAYDESPVTDAYRTARIPDNNRVWMSMGINYKISPSSSLDAGFTHIFMMDSSLNQGTIGSATGQLRGSYDSNINIFSLQYTQAF